MQLGAITAAAAIGFMLLWGNIWMGMRIDNQNDRNTYLQDQIKQVDARLTKIKDLENVRAQLLGTQADHRAAAGQSLADGALVR
jgi:type IV pilus assembly protein PilN